MTDLAFLESLETRLTDLMVRAAGSDLWLPLGRVVRDVRQAISAEHAEMERLAEETACTR